MRSFFAFWESFFDSVESFQDNVPMSQPDAGNFIPTSYSRIVARELGLQERDLPRLLRGTGLSTEVLLAGDESRMSGDQQLQVLANAREIGKAPDFGLRLGHQLKPSSHGPIGYLALASPNLLTALRSLADFLPIRIPFAQLEITLEGQWIVCDLNIDLACTETDLLTVVECFVLAIQELVESFLDRKLTEALVLIGAPQPAHHARYLDYIHSQVRFDQPGHRLLIPASLGGETNPAGAPDSYAAARELCARLLDQVPLSSHSMTNRVKRFLLAQPVGSVSEDDVARSLYVSKRTLARRLKLEGSGYRQIRDELLAEMAAQHLQEARLSVEAIAALLGYHDSANFRRAFKRWFNQSPTQFRNRHCSS